MKVHWSMSRGREKSKLHLERLVWKKIDTLKVRIKYNSHSAIACCYLGLIFLIIGRRRSRLSGGGVGGVLGAATFSGLAVLGETAGGRGAGTVFAG